MDHEVGGRLALVRMVLPGGRPPTWCCLQNACCCTVGVRLKGESNLLICRPPTSYSTKNALNFTVGVRLKGESNLLICRPPTCYSTKNALNFTVGVRLKGHPFSGLAIIL